MRKKNADRKRTVRLEASIARLRAKQWKALANMYAADTARTRKSGVLGSDLAVQTVRAVLAEPTRNERRV